MNELKMLSPKQVPFVSLHDCKITKISLNKKSVELIFDGYDVIENGNVTHIKNGKVVFLNCDEDDFFCYLLKWEPTEAGAEFYGLPISLSDLEKQIENGERIEIFVSAFEYNFIHLRGAVCKNKGNGRAPLIIIETHELFPVSYCWEE